MAADVFISKQLFSIHFRVNIKQSTNLLPIRTQPIVTLHVSMLLYVTRVKYHEKQKFPKTAHGKPFEMRMIEMESIEYVDWIWKFVWNWKPQSSRIMRRISTILNGNEKRYHQLTCFSHRVCCNFDEFYKWIG